MSTAKLVRLSSLQADVAKERDGDWIPANDLGPGVAFNVRSTEYPPFKTARDLASTKLFKKYSGEPAATESEMESRTEESASINGMLAVEHLLLGWRGLDVEFTEEVATQILTDESYRRVRNSVYVAAQKVGQRDLEFVAAAGKNSEVSSGTG